MSLLELRLRLYLPGCSVAAVGDSGGSGGVSAGGSICGMRWVSAAMMRLSTMLPTEIAAQKPAPPRHRAPLDLLRRLLGWLRRLQRIRGSGRGV